MQCHTHQRREQIGSGVQILGLDEARAVRRLYTCNLKVMNNNIIIIWYIRCYIQWPSTRVRSKSGSTITGEGRSMDGLMGIDTETWRARIGLYHAASVTRHIKKQKLQAEQLRCAEHLVWQMVNAASSPCQFGLASLIVLICLRCSLDKPNGVRACRASFHGSRCKVAGALFAVANTSTCAVTAAVCRGILRILLLLCGDVELNPGPLSESEFVQQKLIYKTQ